MDRANISTIMETTSKAIISKMRREEREDIISVKEEFQSLNLIPLLPKFQKYIFPMELSMLENREMDREKDQEKLYMQMAVFMMESGQMIKKMETDNTNIQTKPNIMENGKKT